MVGRGNANGSLIEVMALLLSGNGILTSLQSPDNVMDRSNMQLVESKMMKMGHATNIELTHSLSIEKTRVRIGFSLFVMNIARLMMLEIERGLNLSPREATRIEGRVRD